jgi:hypothetical protein
VIFDFCSITESLSSASPSDALSPKHFFDYALRGEEHSPDQLRRLPAVFVDIARRAHGSAGAPPSAQSCQAEALW